MGSSSKSKPMKGREIVIKCLEKHGVDTIFAYPGGASMELHQALQDSSIRTVLPRHEQGGGFAAAGYARATGKVGVCMATSGPGATNLLTAVADCFVDSIPVVFLTGQVPYTLIGRNAFQETDIIGMARPVVKHSYFVLDANDLPRILAEAFYLAQTGRPGPVIVDIPKNVQQQVCSPKMVKKAEIKTYQPDPKFDAKDITRIKDAIAQSKRPCVYAGGGIITAGASKELTKFAEAYNIPVVTTLMGIGAIPEDNPLSLKWLGMHGAVYANYAANESDLLLTFGARFDDRVTGPCENFCPHAKIVHVDIDQAEINKNKHTDIGVVANIKDVLHELNKAPVYQEYKEWHASINEMRERYPLAYNEKNTVQPQYVIEKLCELTNNEAIVVTGVGQHQMWSAQFYDYKHPRQLITSGGLGTMGFGLPAAMGAKLACPNKTVVNIDGDGSFQMNIQELGTIHNENIDVKIIIINNQHLGMVAQWEDHFYGSRRGNTELKNDRVQRPYPDFVRIAAGYEVPGREVYTKEDVVPAIKEMLESKGAFILDIHTEYEEHVLPMIPPGKTYKESLTK